MEARTRTLIGPLIVRSGFVIVAAGCAWYFYQRKGSICYNQSRQRRKQNHQEDSITSAYESLIGDTPMIELQHLSRLLKRRIFVKLEHLNPGGTGKDRAARSMILAAERQGALPVYEASHELDDVSGTRFCISTTVTSTAARCNPLQGDNQHETSNVTNATISAKDALSVSMDKTMDAAIQKAVANMPTSSTKCGMIVEGTSGSTGISLAALARCRNHACIVVLPDDQASEKRVVLEALSAVVLVVPTHSISHPHHYVNVARKLAERARLKYNMQAVFMDQFDNLANFQVHYEETGPEVWEQCQRNVQAVCLSAGTGGTIAGVGQYLKQMCPSIRIVLVDPPGSSLYHKIVHGVCFAPQQSERTLQRHRYDTLAEGIGLDRVTRNLQAGLNAIDSAIQVSDQEALDMAHWLLRKEGLWVGSSSAMNVVGAVRTAMELPEASKIVTFVCDSGQRHVTRFWNRDFVESRNLEWPGVVSSPLESPIEKLPDCIREALFNYERE